MENNKKSNRKNTERLRRIGFNIKLKREQLGMSQLELDAITKLKSSRYEPGENEMTITTLFVYSEALGVEVYDLIK